VFSGPKTGENAQEDAETVLIPNSTLRYTFNQLGWIGHIELTPKPGVDAIPLEAKVKSILMERHKVHPDDKGVIGSFNVQKEFNKFMDLFFGIAAFSWVVAIGTLISGAIGVGNIMLIVVKERTKEIGVRKAIGATSSSIVAMVIQEALVITLIAGYWGLAFGVLVLELMGLLVANGNGGMFGKPEINLGTAITALAILVAAALLAALLPASKAASVNPIVALQDE
jgi:putative ABC transport system permease protein